jgi:hypothetical protein
MTRRTTSADVECVLLGRMGFSYRLISARTGLSVAQIKLRLKQTGSYVRAYRNGESHLATRIADLSHVEAKQLMAAVRKQLTA